MGHDQSRRFWVLCVVFGVGVIAFAQWFGTVIPNATCSGALPPGVSALLVYQMARTPADIEAVFGNEPCRTSMIAALDRANTVDLVGFIATYSAFLACFFLALGRAGAGARLGLAAVVVTAALDVIETSTQLRITGELPGSATLLTLLAIGSIGKFLGLAVISVCAGLAMIARGRIAGRAAGAVCIAGGVLVVVGLAAASARTALSMGGAVAWIVMLLYALQASFRRA